MQCGTLTVCAEGVSNAIAQISRPATIRRFILCASTQSVRHFIRIFQCKDVDNVLTRYHSTIATVYWHVLDSHDVLRISLATSSPRLAAPSR